MEYVTEPYRHEHEMASQGKSVKQHGEDGRVQIAIQNGTSPTASN